VINGERYEYILSHQRECESNSFMQLESEYEINQFVTVRMQCYSKITNY